MHKFLYLSLVLLSFSSVVFAQSCVKVNATFTQTQVCEINYNVAPQYNNGTANDRLASFFASMTTRITYPCAAAYAAYYCSVAYPSCDNVTASKPPCSDNCNSSALACAGQEALFSSAPLPLPTRTECAALSNVAANCSAPASTDLEDYFCEPTDKTRFVQAGAQEQYIICAVKSPVVIKNDSYATADRVWNTLSHYAQTHATPDTVEKCFMALSKFYCGLAFAPCPSDQVPGSAQNICADACRTFLSECTDYAANFSASAEGDDYRIPLPSVCSGYPTVNCYTIADEDINLSYFFSNETIIVTPSPTPGPEGPVYPPGGPARGGGIGAGVLVGLLLIVAILMLIMKKQDSR